MSGKRILNYLKENLSLSNSSFTKRIISQKTIYILQEMGIKTEYNFNWYLYGVYSQALADDIFHYNDEGIETTEEQKEIIQKFLELGEENISNPLFLEMASSIIFIKKSNQFLTNDEIFEKIIKVKPHLNDKNFFLDTLEKMNNLVFHKF